MVGFLMYNLSVLFVWNEDGTLVQSTSLVNSIFTFFIILFCEQNINNKIKIMWITQEEEPMLIIMNLTTCKNCFYWP